MYPITAPSCSKSGDFEPIKVISIHNKYSKISLSNHHKNHKINIYDLNGNITRLWRTGKSSSNTALLVD
ncbi:hypothetical protein, partial [Chryseobacterium bernardetii]|uniref:hypothetical protein n=1 Tax=Chryseobacterium bernardetii TaxID=1241978 RepID=UPI001E3C1167